jgi:hypothetical protein
MVCLCCSNLTVWPDTDKSGEVRGKKTVQPPMAWHGIPTVLHEIWPTGSNVIT